MNYRRFLETGRSGALAAVALVTLGVIVGCGDDDDGVAGGGNAASGGNAGSAAGGGNAGRAVSGGNAGSAGNAGAGGDAGGASGAAGGAGSGAGNAGSAGSGQAGGAGVGLDASFGEQGIVLLDELGSESYSPRTYAQGPGGRVSLLTRRAQQPFGADALITRLNADGSVDPTFGGGTVIYPNFEAHHLIVLPDGKAVVAGRPSSGQQNELSFLRWNADGTPDASFGQGGLATVELEYPHIYSTSIVQMSAQGDRLIAAGTSSYPGNGFEYESAAFALRLDADGSLDDTFHAPDGVAHYHASEGQALYAANEYVSRLIARADGSLVLLGSGQRRVDYESESDVDFLLLRLNADGAFDASFGEGGALYVDHRPATPPGAFGNWCHAGAQAADGALVAGGLVGSVYPEDVGAPDQTRPHDVMFARWLPDGSPDPAFGQNGLLTIDLGSSGDTITDLAALPDGSTLALAEGGELRRAQFRRGRHLRLARRTLRRHSAATPARRQGAHRRRVLHLRDR
ncbi:MAG: delta-60 repeat domain-containing protein [Polyangiaceae bacterium]|nr:delta-60 repeat domain-containing protein [Polyangiaceae bacterium]